MSIHSQLEALTDNIEASYALRAETISHLVSDTRQNLDELHRQRTRMSGDLKQSLATDRSRRKSQVQKMRTRNEKSRKDMAGKLAVFLSSAEQERNAEFALLSREIQEIVTAIETNTADTLARFKREREETAKSFKATLSRETDARMAEIHRLLSSFAEEHREMARSIEKELAAFRRNLNQAVTTMMADYTAAHRQAHSDWENLSREMAARRAGKRAISAEAKAGQQKPKKDEAFSGEEASKKANKRNTPAKTEATPPTKEQE